ncbi:actin-5c-related [Anaeramoeba flamelloides]|uniref:Actin-5c-related n=1 Tax=Anaeramoeba flamelloides TaxID=1746091 RepID=A0ABQ8YKW2_9EUKA|nr:actin-5c-related [Anaeramoeba flamelloides]
MNNLEFGSTVIIDLGSDTTVSGFSDDEYPRSMFPSVVGKMNEQNKKKYPFNYKEFYVGEQAVSKRFFLDLKYPFFAPWEITDWEYTFELLHHTFYNELVICPEEHPLVLLEPCLSKNNNRMKLTEYLFETHNCCSLSFLSDPEMSLYNSFIKTGLVLSVGASGSWAVPIYEGSRIEYATKFSSIAGKTIDQYLLNKLNSKGNKLQTTAEKEMVKDIKIKHCRVPKKIKQESIVPISYELPDGKFLDLDQEILESPEIAFKVGKLKDLGIVPFEKQDNFINLHEIINQAILSSPIEIQDLLWQNIICVGGSTMFDGFASRLQSELYNLFAENQPTIKVQSVESPMFWSYMGASRFACSNSFKETHLSRKEYKEWGLKTVMKKFL